MELELIVQDVLQIFAGDGVTPHQEVVSFSGDNSALVIQLVNNDVALFGQFLKGHKVKINITQEEIAD